MAGRIPQHFIEDLLSRVDIVDVISQRVELKKSGSNYSACCPFHNEKTPSFTVSQTKQFYHCFGCQENGTAISFIMNYDNMHFVDAVEMLAETVGLEVPREAGEKNRQDSRKPLYDIMQQCANYYYDQLKHSEAAVNYLKNRSLSGETAKKYGIGYAPEGWQNLEQVVTNASSQQLQALGMQIKNEKGRVYDRFRERIMFPIRDRRGRVIAFGGRILDKGEPKYLNSPETLLFHKGEELYGLFEARKSAQDKATVIIVEGYMDVVALSQHGIHNAVATLGTATSTAHIESLFRIVPNLVFCFDGDRAGREAAWRALKVTLPALHDGRDAHFSFLPNGEDPDSFISANGQAAFSDFLGNALAATDFMLQHLSIDLDISEVGGKARLAQLSKPLVDTLPDSIYKQLTVQKIETLIGTSLGSPVIDPVQQIPEQSQTESNNTPPRHSASPSILRRAVALVLQKPVIVKTLDVTLPASKNQSVGEELFKQLISLCKATPEIKTAGLLEHFRDSSMFSGLGKLASQDLLPNGVEISEEAAAQELNDIIIKLDFMARKRDADLVPGSHRMGLMGTRKNQKPS